MKLVFVIFLSFLLSGCVSSPSVSKAKESSKVLQNFLQSQKKREKVVSRIFGKLQFRFQQEQNSFPGLGKLVKFDSKSRLEVSDPMGRVRYWLLGDDTGVLAYYQAEQKAYSAAQGGVPYFKKFFGVSLTWREFQDLWLGVLPKKWRKENEYKYEITDSEKKISIQLSDQSSQVVDVKIDQEREIWEMHFSDFDACCSSDGEELQLAHSLEIKIPSQETKITIEWEEANVLEEAPNPAGFVRKLPPKTTVIDLK